MSSNAGMPLRMGTGNVRVPIFSPKPKSVYAQVPPWDQYCIGGTDKKRLVEVAQI